jgi:protein-L-isoaspartate(D-aspartate) O-methyltransferase
VDEPAGFIGTGKMGGARVRPRRKRAEAMAARLAGALVAPLLATPSCAEAPRDVSPSELRERMVREQIEGRGVSNTRVLAAMRAVPRHRFVPDAAISEAYADHPLPIGHGQTISQPYIVASMTELVDPQPTDTLLEIGTGSGYQAAILGRLAARVYSIELLPELAASARARLAEQGYENVEVITGDGYQGLPAKAPFDGIVVTAAPPDVPPALVEQLAVGGKLVIPVGRYYQELKVLERSEEGIVERTEYPVRFVPLVKPEP